MMFRNTFKLLFSNANLIWKSAVYKIACVIFVSLLSLNWLNPIFNKIVHSTVFGDTFVAFFNGFFSFNGKVIAENFNEIINILTGDVVKALAGNIWLVLVLFVIVLPFLLRLSNIADCEYLYGSMSSKTNYSYTNCFIRSLKKSIKLELSRLLITIPFTAIFCVGIFGIVTLLCSNESVAILTPTVLTLYIVLLVSIKKSFMVGIEGAIVVKDYSTWNAYKKSARLVKKNFGRIFYAEFVMTLLAVFVNILVTSFTFGVGLIITLPLTATLFSILKMVVYYTAEGMDFYCEPNTICHNKRVEEQLTIKDNKYII